VARLERDFYARNTQIFSYRGSVLLLSLLIRERSSRVVEKNSLSKGGERRRVATKTTTARHCTNVCVLKKSRLRRFLFSCVKIRLLVVFFLFTTKHSFRLTFTDHFRRRRISEDSDIVRTVMELSVEGRRGKGRPKKKWLNGIKCDMRGCVHD